MAGVGGRICVPVGEGRCHLYPRRGRIVGGEQQCYRERCSPRRKSQWPHRVRDSGPVALEGVIRWGRDQKSSGRRARDPIQEEPLASKDRL